MKKEIKFRMLAYTDAAGKYTRGAVREGNEDNFYADDDLSDNVPSQCIADKIVSMSDCGLLMVVADGMGGQNAGEVASQIAVDTVREYFMPEQITHELASTHENRRKYMESVIKEADARIKKEAKHNVEHQGMGSTIIMAWIIGNKMTISWCGDSRAYRYNPTSGIELLSRDHSYVQELVNKGKISYEDTFEHPQGNIVTRSLGDESQKARPESREYDIYDSDIILLCSDGLSGVLRDKKTYDANGNLLEGENIEDIIKDNHATLTKCREALWTAAEKAEWYDNVTVVLCEIISGIGKEYPIKKSKKEDKDVANKSFKGITLRISNKTMLIALIAFFVLFGTGIGIKHLIQNFNAPRMDGKSDTLTVESVNEDPNHITMVSTLIGKLDSLYTVLNDQEVPNYVKQDLSDLSKKDITIIKDEIRRVETVLALWGQKRPFITEINILKKQNNKDKQKISACDSLLKRIINADNINKKDWNKDIGRIRGGNVSTPSKQETVKKDDDELTQITSKEISFYFTIKKGNTYVGLIATIKDQYKDCNIKEIRLKENPSIKITQTNIRNYIEKEAEAILIPN